MQIYTVSLFGHRIIEDPISVERKLEKLIRQLIHEKEYVEFLVGRNGAFDQLTASVIRRVKRTVRADNSTLVPVLPYPTAEYRETEESFQSYYDEIEICDYPNAHFKAAIQARNRAMVDRSDLSIFYVTHNQGGAAQTLRYAQKQNKNLINLSLPM